MDLKGWVRASLIDYADHIATTFFTGSCNFRCPMCHNSDLVLRPGALPALSESEVWTFLARRVGKVTGVVVTGGEPTLQPDLCDFLRRVRDLGYATKLDTNGYCPETLASLLDAGVLDYVAIDVKAPPEKYARLSGVSGVDVTRIERSLTLLHKRGLPHEWRTTVVPDWLIMDDIEALARWVAAVVGEPAATLYLQQFRGVNTLDPALEKISPYPMATLHAMADRARQWLPHVVVRGGL
ncbi:MAG: anaerobic ribonucleoside-triphosphate reductase activating protein [Anaerolineae bacterium]|nr:anaerobic ribonucleoside-triphosphate reductase activating protein [Anaerolineae bacterium]